MKKVLIVEDTKQLADLYKIKLEKEFQIMVLPDGDKVLEACKDWQPNLIILDLILPGDKNGFDLIRELKREDTTKEIPIILYSSLSPEAMPPSEGEEKMVVAHLDKSTISVDDLLQAVKHNIA